MFDSACYSDRIRLVLRLADEEARAFQHEYIGTEHLLLGLMRVDSGVASIVLRSHGIDFAKIRHEVEQLVQYGPHHLERKELSLTPRAQQALEFAEEDAGMVGQSAVDTEHVLTGLLREPDGVAGVVLRKFGLELAKLGAEVFKIRLLQMKIVERVVRPLRAHIHRKRKIRDELLVHLSAIYDEEIAKSDDPAAAVDAASKRFGDPAELTGELQETVPRLEQWAARSEPMFAWRAPETAARWMLRVATRLALIMLVVCVIAATIALGEFGWSSNIWHVVRPIVATTIVLPVSVFAYGTCYYKMRDHLFGVFGSQKSWVQVATWAGLLNLATVGAGFVFFWITYGSLAAAAAAFYPIILFGILWAAGALVVARIYGPREIRDASWALLDLSD